MLWGLTELKFIKNYYFSKGVIDTPKIIKSILLDIAIKIENALSYGFQITIISP